MQYVTGRLYTTVGCHPTRCKEFEETDKGVESAQEYYDSLCQLVTDNRSKVVSIGECGLGKLLLSR